MDKVKTNIEALKRCRAILDRLEEDVTSDIAKVSNELRENFSGVDANYQKDLSIYMEYLAELKTSIDTFVDENSKAIEDRIRNIIVYNQTAYKPRNII